MACVPGDVDGNRENADAMLARAAVQGAELALLPELALNGYVLSAGLWTQAEPIGGPLTRWLCDAARRYRLHLGTTLIEAAGDHFHNSFLLATPGGEIAGVARKSRPAWVEARWYRGVRGPHVIDTAIGRIGVGICYENYLAGPLRTLAQASPALVLQPTAAATPPAAWPIGAHGAAAFDAMLARLAEDHARALDVPVVMANMCGDHEVAGFATRFPGLSSIVSGGGEIQARLGGKEGVIAADVTLGGERADPGGVGRLRYWTAPMPWYAPAWPVAQHLCAVGYRFDGVRRRSARVASGAAARTGSSIRPRES